MEDIIRWFTEGRKKSADFMLVVCDDFSHEDYPVYLSIDEFDSRYTEISSEDMQTIMASYNLSIGMERQINQYRCHEMPPASIHRRSIRS
jgi:hypothetical protein